MEALTPPYAEEDGEEAEPPPAKVSIRWNK